MFTASWKCIRTDDKGSRSFDSQRTAERHCEDMHAWGYETDVKDAKGVVLMHLTNAKKLDDSDQIAQPEFIYVLVGNQTNVVIGHALNRNDLKNSGWEDVSCNNVISVKNCFSNVGFAKLYHTHYTSLGVPCRVLKLTNTYTILDVVIG